MDRREQQDDFEKFHVLKRVQQHLDIPSSDRDICSPNETLIAVHEYPSGSQDIVLNIGGEPVRKIDVQVESRPEEKREGETDQGHAETGSGSDKNGSDSDKEGEDYDTADECEESEPCAQEATEPGSDAKKKDDPNVKEQEEGVEEGRDDAEQITGQGETTLPEVESQEGAHGRSDPDQGPSGDGGDRHGDDAEESSGDSSSDEEDDDEEEEKDEPEVIVLYDRKTARRGDMIDD